MDPKIIKLNVLLSCSLKCFTTDLIAAFTDYVTTFLTDWFIFSFAAFSLSSILLSMFSISEFGRFPLSISTITFSTFTILFSKIPCSFEINVLLLCSFTQALLHLFQYQCQGKKLSKRLNVTKLSDKALSEDLTRELDCKLAELHLGQATIDEDWVVLRDKIHDTAFQLLGPTTRKKPGLV